MAGYTETGRRLPIYLLLDVSGSMDGEKITGVNQGMQALVSELTGESKAVETAYLSVITFSDTAQQLAPLASLPNFSPPTLEAAGETSLGAALELLKEVIDNEVHKGTSPVQKGDWKPLVFLMTDGCPTDDYWQQAADALKTVKPKPNIIALAIGADADETVLKRITENVMKMEKYQPGAFRTYFKWMTQSILNTASSFDSNAQAVTPPPPLGFTIVP
jgi:uncharacterized protein YegL